MDVYLCICVCVLTKSLQSCLTLCNPIVALQAPLFMGFSWQEYWSWVAMHSSGGSSYPEIEPRSPALQADSLSSESPRKPKAVVK